MMLLESTENTMSKALLFLVYIPHTRALTYYQYLYVAIDYDGP